MLIFDDYTKNVLMCFSKHKVAYIVIGGYAVNFYGYRRTTGDIDLWIKPENGVNKENIISAFKELEVGDFVIEELRGLDFTKHLVFSDGDEPFKIDFITHISGVSFEEAWDKRVISKLDEIEMPFIHYNHLILSKISTNRERDKIDLEQLQKINSFKK